MKKLYVVSLGLLFLIGFTPAVLFAQKAIELKAATAFTNNTVWEKGFFMLFDRINKDPRGKVKLNYVGGPEAIPPFELGESVRSGVVDIIEDAASYIVAQVPEADAMKLSQLTPAQERESGAYDLLRKIIAEKLNAHYLGRIHPGIAFHFYTKSKVEKTADFRGLKTRVSPLYKPFLLALGGVPIVMPHSDVYQGLEQGIVQAICAGEIGIYERAWHEQLKFIVKPAFYTNEQIILINLNTWNKLPQDVQRMFTDMMLEVERDSGTLIMEVAAKERKDLLSAGMKEISLSDGDKFYDLAYDSGWKWVIEKCPAYGPELKKRLSKK